MNIEVGHIVIVKNLSVQTTMGAYSYSGKIEVTNLVPTGTKSRLKIRAGNKPQEPLISKEDYFWFNVLDGRETTGTASRSKTEKSYVMRVQK